MKDGVGRFVNVLYRQLQQEQEMRKYQHLTYLETTYGVQGIEIDDL